MGLKVGKINLAFKQEHYVMFLTVLKQKHLRGKVHEKNLFWILLSLAFSDAYNFSHMRQSEAEEIYFLLGYFLVHTIKGFVSSLVGSKMW